MIPETGEILPKDATCFLDVPVNKTSPAFTKPVHPLVGKRVNEWEQARPAEQPRAVDQKTGEAHGMRNEVSFSSEVALERL
jgi:hypothetical protein